MGKLRALLLVSVVVAAAAAPSAQAYQFTAASYPVSVSGAYFEKNSQTFVTEEGTIRCEKFHLATVVLSGATAQLRSVPEYQNCLHNESLLEAVEVHTNNCEYGFSATSLSEGVYLGPLAIDASPTWCKTEGGIFTKAYLSSTFNCRISIGTQTLSSVEYQNNAEGILAKFSLSGLHYSLGSGCKKTGSFENGKMTGIAQLKGESEGKSVAISVN